MTNSILERWRFEPEGRARPRTFRRSASFGSEVPAAHARRSSVGICTKAPVLAS